MCVLPFILVEHSFLVFNSFHKSNLERTQCKYNITFWESLYSRERPHLSRVLPFNILYLPVVEVSSVPSDRQFQLKI